MMEVGTMFVEVFVIGILTGMSPGPDFFLVMKNSLAHGKKIGIATAAGIGTALTFHATYTVLGLTIIIQSYTWLFKILQALGAAYLAYLGIGGIRALFQVQKLEFSATTAPAAAKSVWQGFKNGLFCNLLNPKAFLFFLGIFSQLLSSNTAKWIEWVYAFEIVLATSLWFVFLSMAISTAFFRRIYGQTQKIIDGIFGGILMYFSYRMAKNIFD
jgi:RhtB (resistance to homoserine/threonine) family protein